MTLIEVVVAMGLFLVLITLSLSVLLLSLRTTEVNRDRVAAANLAGRELEIIRGQFSSATRGPETVTINEVVNENPLTGLPGDPVVLDNVRYTVTRTAQWFSVGATAASACDDGTSSELAYLLVNVKVTWDRNGGNPISMDTILTPPKGTYSSATGHIGVKLISATNTPLAGHNVTAKGPTGAIYVYTSAIDGCTVFPFLPPGTYTVSVDDNNFVNRAGIQKVTLTATIQAGQMWHGSIDYDESATINGNFATTSGYARPTVSNLPVSLGNSGLLPAGSMTRTGTTDPRPVPGLWPFPSGYQVWAGSCLDADPQFTGQDRADPVTAIAGGVTGAPVELAAIHVTGAPDGTTVKAVHVSYLDDGSPKPGGGDNACPSGETVTLGVMAGGKLDTSAPYGEWNIIAGTRNDKVTLVRGGSPVSAVLS